MFGRVVVCLCDRASLVFVCSAFELWPLLLLLVGVVNVDALLSIKTRCRRKNSLFAAAAG